ncbi:helix-turn-helix domain-containing protein [Yinghuangia seranimata]|uniref:helix-turn-helix domain-containing protein n=1 Tax=Yinghuangia seranimata TaxID=408067 RepID=UPI00248B0FAE|nr:helix-turn-helix transcriptional regulator [Yinghuangia seranimata]MDI2129761.1 helix-turn-helix transcriptional regulator [Yinghuangia seranimata]
MEPARDTPARPPFSPAAARRARAGLHMTHDQVAYGLAAFRIMVSPRTVADWETGYSAPSEAELLALAETLWCSPADLMGSAGALREHRIGQRLSAAELCMRIGVPEARYRAMEEANTWRGDERSTAALVRELGLSLRDLVTVSGASAEVERLLVETVRGRPKSQLGPMTRLVGLRRSRVAAALAGVHDEFAHRARVTLSWSDGVPGARPRTESAPTPDLEAEAGRMADRFWELLGRPVPEYGQQGVWQWSRLDGD